MRVTRERSELSVPAANWRMIEKALGTEADVVMLDLEDSVAPDQKAAARSNVIRALRELDWGKKPPAYRINALDTAYCYRDLIEVVEAVGDRLSLVVVPKVGRSEDLAVIDTLLHQIELAVELTPGAIQIEAQIESASGLVHVDDIAPASPRLGCLIFGPGDYAATVRMPLANIGTEDEWDALYPGHRFHYPMSRMVVAARAAGLRAIDGPVADFRDLEAFRRSCLIARSLGYDGKWCIHPNQIPIANDVFSPTPQEISWAQRVEAAYEQATASGRGAISLDGHMIDVASIKLARATLQRAGLETISQ